MTLAGDDTRPQSGAPDLRGAPAAVLADLRERAGDAGAVVVTSGEIASAVGLTVRSVRRALAHLLALDALRVEPARGAANRYVLT